jgi:putative PIN family toxin of toxin-antitoxin system
MKAESSQRTAAHRVVIDTNVWISAALSKSGAPAQLVRHVLEHGLPVFSPATFAELETRLWRPKFDRYLSMDLRQRILHDMNAAAHWVDVPPEIAAQTYCRDVDDDKFIHTALAAQAPWLVTGDQDLLEVSLAPGLCILSPADALQQPEFCP